MHWVFSKRIVSTIPNPTPRRSIKCMHTIWIYDLQHWDCKRVNWFQWFSSKIQFCALGRIACSGFLNWNQIKIIKNLYIGLCHACNSDKMVDHVLPSHISMIDSIHGFKNPSQETFCLLFRIVGGEGSQKFIHFHVFWRASLLICILKRILDPKRVLAALFFAWNSSVNQCIFW